ncbi:MAG: type II toxin-antitoxin system VapC family toxin [Nocardioides sp.]
MIVDSSAVVAVIRGEPEADAFSELLGSSTVASMSAGTLLETSVVLGPRQLDDLDDLLGWARLMVAPFDEEQARAARAAYLIYGKRSGSRARLNFGDCFSYALAKVTGQPLLFKGDDFSHTDITPAR